MRLAVKLVLVFGIIYALFLGFIMFLFGSTTEDINHEIPQVFGGAILISGIEEWNYDFCKYDLNLSYLHYGSGDSNYIGKIDGYFDNNTMCSKEHFYSKFRIVEEKGSFTLKIQAGKNDAEVFVSNDLHNWHQSDDNGQNITNTLNLTPQTSLFFAK